MSKIAFIIFTFLSNVLFAQKCSAFNLDILQQYSKTSDTIRPVFQKGGFRFINIVTQKNIFDKVFEEAYPFYRNIAIVKYHNEYKLIDKKGEFVITQALPDFVCKPIVDSLQPNLLWFGDVFTYIYDDVKNPWEINREILANRNSFTTYKSENNKYGFSCSDRFETIKSIPKYDTIISISENYVLAKINNRYGLENTTSQIIVDYLLR
jgi:hypothetical protein